MPLCGGKVQIRVTSVGNCAPLCGNSVVIVLHCVVTVWQLCGRVRIRWAALSVLVSGPACRGQLSVMQGSTGGTSQLSPYPHIIMSR